MNYRTRLLTVTLIVTTWLTTALSAQTPEGELTGPGESLINEQACFAVTIDNQGPTGYQPYLRLWIPAEMDASSLEVDLLGEAVTAVSTVGVFSGGELNDPLLPEDDPNDAVSGPAGYTLVRISLPVGSLIDGGPGLEVNLCLELSGAGVTVGEPLELFTQVVYRFGDTPTGENGSVAGAQWSTVVTPALYNVSHNVSQPSTVPGNCIPVEVTATVNIADQEVVNGLSISELLPPGFEYIDVMSITPGCIVQAEPPVNGDGELLVLCNNVAGTEVPDDIEITYIAVIDDIVAADSCLPEELEATGTVTSNQEGTVNDVMPVSVQHVNAAPMAPTMDPLPGATVVLGTEFTVTGFNEVDELLFTVTLPDGLSYVGNAELEGVSVPEVSLVNNGDGTTTIAFDLHAANGSNFASCASAQFLFDAIINETYSGGESVSAGDALTCAGTLTYSLNGEPGDCDLSVSPGYSILSAGFEKSIVSAPADPSGFVPGETITYRLELLIPSGDAREVIFDDFFPIPIHDVSDISLTFGEDIVWAPTDNAGITPLSIVSDPALNRLTIDWGTISTPSGGPPVIIAADISVEVTAEPFADGLVHSNFASFSNENAAGDVLQTTDLVTFDVGAPELQIFKGVVSTDQPDASLSPIMSPVNANVSFIDAWDYINFRVTLQNIGAAPAYDVIVNDFPPSPELDDCVLQGVVDGEGNAVNYTGNLFTAGLVVEQVPPQQPGLADQVYVNYQCRVQGNIVARDVVVNEALVSYAAIPGGSDQFPGLSETASIAFARPVVELNVLNIEPGYAEDDGVHVGELVTFEMVTTMPEGFTNDASLEVTLPEGLSLEEVISLERPIEIVYGTGSTNQVMNTLTIEDLGPDPADQRRGFTLTMGTTQNAGGDNDDKEAVRLVFSAVVLNTEINQNGHQLPVEAACVYRSPINNAFVQESDTYELELREAELEVSVTFLESELLPGDETFVTVAVGHTQQSTGNAYNVELLNDLPVGLQFVSGSFINECDELMGSGPAHNFGSISAEWDSIPLGVTCELVYIARVSETFPPCTTTELCAEVEFASAFDLHLDTLNYGPVNPMGVRRTGNTNDMGGELNDYFLGACDQLEVVTSNLSTPTIVGSQSFCEGEDLTISIPQYAGTIVQYHWSGPAVPPGYNNPELIIPDADPSASGEYSVFVEIGQCATDESAPFNVLVNERPQVTVDAVNLPCASGLEDLTLTPEVVGGEGPYSFAWSGPNYFSADSLAVIEDADESNSGVYNLTVTDQNGCAAAPVNAQVNISTAPPLPEIDSGATLCEGATLSLECNNYTGAIAYHWQGPSDEVTTVTPVLTISSADPSMSGSWTVSVELENCASDPSTEVLVTVNPQPAAPVFAANATSLCAGETLTFTTTADADGYTWSGPNGYSANTQSPPAIESVTVLGEGTYSLVVTENGCASEAFTLPLTVNPLPETPGLGSNSPLCEGDALLLSASAMADVFEWYLPDGSTQNTVSSSLMIQNVTAGQQGNYRLRISDGTCWSLLSNEEEVVVDAIPEEQAFAGNDPVACEGQDLILQAANDLSLSGFWSSTHEEVQIASPNAPATGVTGLQPGQTYSFTWSLFTEGCGVYSTDELNVIAPESPEAYEDYAEMLQNDMIDLFVTENDDFGSVAYTISIIDQPDFGQAEVNGDAIIEYRPETDYSGEDELVYELCVDACPNMCDTAVVRLQVFPVLRIPDVMTPNGDGMNDFFEIEGIDRFPQNELYVYNRWGREIYSATDYSNEWDATFNGVAVPNGTYFYVLNNRLNGQQLAQGYVTIHQ